MLNQTEVGERVRQPEHQPLIIGHRGASGHRPEHTASSYRLAIAMGADVIEPDLVATRDGHLIASHEPDLGPTTDVADKFPDRQSIRVVDGVTITGWFSVDFTLAEIKTLRRRQRWSFRSTAWDGCDPVLTFDEVIAIAKEGSAATGRAIMVYPETKHPTWHAALGLALEPPLLASLEREGWTTPEAPVFIQSFEIANLRTLAPKTGVRLIQLLDEPHLKPFDVVNADGTTTYADMMTPDGLAEIAGYAFGIGPWKRSIIATDAEGRALPPGPLIQNAHAAGLRVHAYTFRDEPRFLPKGQQDDPASEYHAYFAAAIDGVFSDHPDTAFRARQSFMRNPHVQFS